MVLTLYYNKITGKIRTYCLAEVGQDMTFFGENQEEMEIVLDFVNIDYTDSMRIVIDNSQLFYIDVNTKELKQREFNI